MRAIGTSGRFGSAEDVVDAGAEREDRFELRQFGEQPVRWTPDDRVAHRGAVDERFRRDDRAARQQRGEALAPRPLVPAGGGEQQAHAATPPIRAITGSAIFAGGAAPM